MELTRKKLTEINQKLDQKFDSKLTKSGRLDIKIQWKIG